uniref:Uncharacterized protein n=1 Tax=Iridovirus sp. TaxID=135728 RepID=A0AAU7YBB9_9VIRU
MTKFTFSRFVIFSLFFTFISVSTFWNINFRFIVCKWAIFSFVALFYIFTHTSFTSFCFFVLRLFWHFFSRM